MDIPADLLQTVYIKTDKAHEEIAHRNHGLRLKARQVLVLLDGARTVGMLAAVLVGLELTSIIKELEHAGFIEPVSTPLPSSALQRDMPIAVPSSNPAPASVMTVTPPVETALDPLTLLEVKLMMETATQQYLGLLGADLRQLVAGVKDSAGLRSAMARWHMALRESRKGADAADELLQQAKTMLGWVEI